jgi:hypothetical protein
LAFPQEEIQVRTLLLPLVLLGVTGCATVPKDEASRSRPLVAENLTPLGTLTGLDAVRQLRPEWLVSCPDCPQPMVRFQLGGWHAIDDPRGGRNVPVGLDHLASIRVSDIMRMHFIEPVRTRGRGYPGGLIVVTTTGRYP